MRSWVINDSSRMLGMTLIDLRMAIAAFANDRFRHDEERLVITSEGLIGHKGGRFVF